MNGRVRYRIVTESLPYGEFRVDPLLGYLIVSISSFRSHASSWSFQVNTELDYEKKWEYSIEVEAMDEGSPMKITTQTILVRVIDENDHPISAIHFPSEVRSRSILNDSPSLLGNHLGITPDRKFHRYFAYRR